MNENHSTKPKIAIILLIVFLLIITISFLVKKYKEIKASKFNRVNIANIALIDIDGKVGLLSISSQSSFFLKLPDDYINTATTGGQMVKESIQENYKIPIFGYIILNQPFQTIENYKKWTKDILISTWQGKNRTDLSKEDFLVLLKKIILRKKKLFSEKEFEDILFNDDFKDQRLRGEGLSIEILNSTGHDGLAKRYSDLFENIGGRVIRLADYEPVLENCQILVNNPNAVNSYTVGVLSESTGCWVGKRGKEENRADITVIIGEDYWKKLNKR